MKINGSVKKKKKHLFFFDKASLLGLKNENTSEAPKKSELKKKEKKDALSDKKKKYTMHLRKVVSKSVKFVKTKYT